MDAIQKTLIKAGRKDLANTYFNKVTAKSGKVFSSKKEFTFSVKAFVDKINKNKSMVKIRVNNSKYEKVNEMMYWSFYFDVYIDPEKDEFLDSSKYIKGEAYIYPSKKFYRIIKSECKRLFEKEPTWNNTKTSGSLFGIDK